MIFAIEGQSILDIAIQESGSVLAALDWAMANDVSITDDIAPGTKLKPIESVFSNADISIYFKSRKQLIATAIAQNSNQQNALGFPLNFPISF